MNSRKIPKKLDQKYIDKAITKNWKKYPIPEKWKGTKKEKSILNLRQYSSRFHTKDAKKSSLSNLRGVTMKSEEENLEEETFALVNRLVDKIGLPGKLEKEKILEKFLLNADEVLLFLNEQEKLFYTRQFLHYLSDYSDLNISDDIDNLHNLIMERLLIKKYRRDIKNTKSVINKEKYDKMLKQSFTRLQKYEANLFTRRKDRVGTIGKGKSLKDLAKDKDISRLEKDKKEQTKDINDWLENIPVKKHAR